MVKTNSVKSDSTKSSMTKSSLLDNKKVRIYELNYLNDRNYPSKNSESQELTRNLRPMLKPLLAGGSAITRKRLLRGQERYCA